MLDWMSNWLPVVSVYGRLIERTCSKIDTLEKRNKHISIGHFDFKKHRWNSLLQMHLYRVSLDFGKNIHKCQRESKKKSTMNNANHSEFPRAVLAIMNILRAIEANLRKMRLLYVLAIIHWELETAVLITPPRLHTSKVVILTSAICNTVTGDTISIFFTSVTRSTFHIHGCITRTLTSYHVAE